MQIQGPFTIEINDNNETGLRELHLGFIPEFQQAELQDRMQKLNEYLTELQQNIETEVDTANQQGMANILQIAQELSPHLAADEIPLEETIIIEFELTETSPINELIRNATLKWLQQYIFSQINLRGKVIGATSVGV